MAVGYNKYPTLHNSETYGEVLQCDSGFTFVDFLPGEIDPVKLVKPRTYENFRVLVDRANEFFRKNRKWKIVTCEGVEFRATLNEINPTKMTYVNSDASCVRGLRLWLTERKDEKEREQQIGYFNLIPQKVEKKHTFETLDRVIERFNTTLQYNPLPGRIITIQSQFMKLPNAQSFDPDLLHWDESGKTTERFISVIRIFYEIMDDISEEIGLTDFIPASLSVFLHPQYEPFSTIMNRASAWLSQQQDLRFCNAQTLEFPVGRDSVVNTQKMEYTACGRMLPKPIPGYGSINFVKVLRLAYAKPVKDKTSPITELTCRSFLPVRLTVSLSVPKYEDLLVTRERISAWIKATGVRVVSAETTAYKSIRPAGERYAIQESLIYDVTDLWTPDKDIGYWIFVIRLYIDGVYKEPPPEMLPAVPVKMEIIKEGKPCINFNHSADDLANAWRPALNLIMKEPQDDTELMA